MSVPFRILKLFFEKKTSLANEFEIKRGREERDEKDGSRTEIKTVKVFFFRDKKMEGFCFHN